MAFKSMIFFIVAVGSSKSILGVSPNWQMQVRRLQDKESIQEPQIVDLKLINLNNIFYGSQIHLGQQNKLFTTIIDTGSTVLWVAGQNCEECLDQGILNLYKCSEENGCRKDDSQEVFDIQYGVGGVSGQIIHSEAFLNNSHLNITFLLVDKIKGLPDFQGNGLIGLGKRENQKEKTFVELLYEARIIPAPIFTLYLTNEACKSTSVLSLGGVRTDFYAGTPMFTNSKSQDFWSVEYLSVAFNQNGQVLKLALKTKQLLIDSGTTKLTFPQQDIEILVYQLQQSYQISCQLVNNRNQPLSELECIQVEIEKYPILNFDLNSTSGETFQLKLNPSDYLNKCYFSFWTLGFKCLMNIQQLDGDEVILGVTFMQQYYTIFNYNEQTIGFAEIKDRQDSISIIELYSRAYSQYYTLLIILIALILFFIVIYFGGNFYISSILDLYASALDKSSSRELEQQTLKTKTSGSMDKIDFPSPQNKEIQFQIEEEK